MEDYLFLIIMAVIGGIIQLDVVKKWKYNWAIDVIQLAVAWVYNGYVKPAKDGSPDGKLSDAQRQEARNKAVEKAKAIAKERGLDLNKVLGEELLEMYVQLAVGKAKGSK
jgi:hypothetical protein